MSIIKEQTLEELRDLVVNSGLDGVLAIVILIVGLVLANRMTRILYKFLLRYIPKQSTVTIICIIFTLLAAMVVIALASIQVGLSPRPIIRMMIIGSFVVIGIILLIGPLLPTLPFKAGQMVRLGEYIGVVESTTLLNTRLRTFDGKVVYVPNRKILDDIIINYHHTKTRRIAIDIGIGFFEDLIKAKQVLEEIMIADPRVLPKPSPGTMVLTIGESTIQLGARCWVANENFWVTKCDLTEKIKLRFDCEGISFAFNQLDVHLHTSHEPTGLDDNTAELCHQSMDRNNAAS
jgi:small conductance mechanosensitive channel